MASASTYVNSIAEVFDDIELADFFDEELSTLPDGVRIPGTSRRTNTDSASIRSTSSIRSRLSVRSFGSSFSRTSQDTVLEELGSLRSFKLAQLCDFIAVHPSLRSAKIVSSSCYAQRAPSLVIHRFLVLKLERPGKVAVWLRLDRRASSPGQFVLAAGTTKANDTAILATSLESICPAAALKENEQVFSHPGSLENLRKFLLVILEELVKYKIWPENCWMFVSLLQQHLGAESGSAFRSGQLMHANLAPETRLLITNRIHLPECQASQARRSVLIPYGPNMDQFLYCLSLCVPQAQTLVPLEGSIEAATYLKKVSPPNIARNSSKRMYIKNLADWVHLLLANYLALEQLAPLPLVSQLVALERYISDEYPAWYSSRDDGLPMALFHYAVALARTQWSLESLLPSLYEAIEEQERITEPSPLWGYDLGAWNLNTFRSVTSEVIRHSRWTTKAKKAAVDLGRAHVDSNERLHPDLAPRKSKDMDSQPKVVDWELEEERDVREADSQYYDELMKGFDVLWSRHLQEHAEELYALDSIALDWASTLPAPESHLYTREFDIELPSGPLDAVDTDPPPPEEFIDLPPPRYTMYKIPGAEFSPPE